MSGGATVCIKHGGPMRAWNEPPDGVRPMHRARGLCWPCYAQEYRAGTLDHWPGVWEREREEFVAYVQYLRDLGFPPEKWAAEMGTTLAALSRRLYRAGHRDLASPIERIRKQQRRAMSG